MRKRGVDQADQCPRPVQTLELGREAKGRAESCLEEKASRGLWNTNTAHLSPPGRTSRLTGGIGDGVFRTPKPHTEMKS